MQNIKCILDLFVFQNVRSKIYNWKYNFCIIDCIFRNTIFAFWIIYPEASPDYAFRNSERKVSKIENFKSMEVQDKIVELHEETA